MCGCQTQGVAIAPARSFPEDDPPGTFAGQQRFSIVAEQAGADLAQRLSPARADTESPSGRAAERDRTAAIWPANPGPDRAELKTPAGGLRFDACLVKEAFARVVPHAPEAMEYFYAHLFIQHPEIRAMFPLEMTEFRGHVFHALIRLAQSMDSTAALGAYAGQLGRAHRKFGVKEKHYRAFLDALLATTAYYNGRSWTARLQAEFSAALDHTAALMQQAAEQDGAQQPSWWVGEIVDHELRTPTLAVLRIRPDQPLRYRAGQHVSVQTPRWPRIWREYSLATAPGAGGLLELHVRAVPGGLISAALVHHSQVGDAVLLGPARGDMTAPADPGRDLLCVAGGSGLAPIKAIIEEVLCSAAARAGQGPGITLFFGARSAAELYDLPALEEMAAGYPQLTVIPVVSAEPGYAGLTGMLPGVVRELASLGGQEIYVCGPDVMVRETRRLLARRSAARFIHHDPPRAGAQDLTGFAQPG
jgi:NAD(P)H-flavin reductase/hemoglobin-like flavoprotein